MIVHGFSAQAGWRAWVQIPPPALNHVSLSICIFEHVFRKRLFIYPLEKTTATAAHSKIMMMVALRCPQ